MIIRPGEEVHFAALLNEKGETLATVPMNSPLICPHGAIEVSAKVSIHVVLASKGKR